MLHSFKLETYVSTLCKNTLKHSLRIANSWYIARQWLNLSTFKAAKDQKEAQFNTDRFVLLLPATAPLIETQSLCQSFWMHM